MPGRKQMKRRNGPARSTSSILKEEIIVDVDKAKGGVETFQPPSYVNDRPWRILSVSFRGVGQYTGTQPSVATVSLSGPDGELVRSRAEILGTAATRTINVRAPRGSDFNPPNATGTKVAWSLYCTARVTGIALVTFECKLNFPVQ